MSCLVIAGFLFLPLLLEKIPYYNTFGDQELFAQYYSKKYVSSKDTVCTYTYGNNSIFVSKADVKDICVEESALVNYMNTLNPKDTEGSSVCKVLDYFDLKGSSVDSVVGVERFSGKVSLCGGSWYISQQPVYSGDYRNGVQSNSTRCNFLSKRYNINGICSAPPTDVITSSLVLSSCPLGNRIDHRRSTADNITSIGGLIAIKDKSQSTSVLLSLNGTAEIQKSITFDGSVFRLPYSIPLKESAELMCRHVHSIADSEAFILASGHQLSVGTLKYWAALCNARPIIINSMDLFAEDEWLGFMFDYYFNKSALSFRRSYIVRDREKHAEVGSECKVLGVVASPDTFGDAVSRYSPPSRFLCLQDVYDGILGKQLRSAERLSAPPSGWTFTLDYVAGYGLSEYVDSGLENYNIDSEKGDSDIPSLCIGTDCAAPWRQYLVEVLELFEVVKSFNEYMPVLSDPNEEMPNHRVDYRLNPHSQSICTAGSGKCILNLNVKLWDSPELSPNVPHHGLFEVEPDIDTVRTVLLPNDISRFGRFSLQEAKELVISTDLVPEYVYRTRKPYNTSLAISNAIGDVQLLIFVYQEDMDYAMEVLQYWKDHCGGMSCAIYARFTVIPVMKQAEGSANCDGILKLTPSIDCEDDYTKNIPYSSVLLHLEDWLSTIASQLDFVGVLIGMEALFAMEQPGLLQDGPTKEPRRGPIKHLNGLIPPAKYGANLRYDYPAQFIASVKPTALDKVALENKLATIQNILNSSALSENSKQKLKLYVDKLKSETNVLAERNRRDSAACLEIKKYFTALKHNLVEKWSTDSIKLFYGVRGVKLDEINQFYHELSESVCNMNINAFVGTALAMGKLVQHSKSRYYDRLNSVQSNDEFPRLGIELNWMMKASVKEFLYGALLQGYAVLDTESRFFKFGFNATSYSYPFVNLVYRDKSSDKIKYCDVINEMRGIWNELTYIPKPIGYYGGLSSFQEEIRKCVKFSDIKVSELDLDYELPVLFEKSLFGPVYLSKENLENGWIGTINLLNKGNWLLSIIQMNYILEVLYDPASAIGGEISSELFEYALANIYIPVHLFFKANFRLATGKYSFEELELMRSLLTSSAVRLRDEIESQNKLKVQGRAKYMPLMANASSSLSLRYMSLRLPHVYGIDLISIMAALSGLEVEAGRYDVGRALFGLSTPVESYKMVQKDRSRWSKQRLNLSQCRDCSVAKSSLRLDVTSILGTSKYPESNVLFESINMDNAKAHQTLLPKVTKLDYSEHIQTHFITVASDMKKELEYLLYTANVIAGVDIKVLGLDETYYHYGNKIDWTFDYIHEQMMVTKTINSNDVIVFMDSYDVLVYPSIRNIGRQFQKSSSTPIVFCSEHGIYPETSSAWFYSKPFTHHQGQYDNENRSYVEDLLTMFVKYNLLEAKHLNSGCFMGRAQQILEMLYNINIQSDYFRDDQQIFARYGHSHPQLVSVDSCSTGTTRYYDDLSINGGSGSLYFRTVFRQFRDSVALVVNADYSIHTLHSPVGGITYLADLRNSIISYVSSVWKDVPFNSCLGYNSVSLMHCNNKGSNSYYAFLVLHHPIVFKIFYSSAVGLKLRDLSFYVTDLQFEASIELLYFTEPFSSWTCLNAASTLHPLYPFEHVLLCYLRFKVYVMLEHIDKLHLYEDVYNLLPQCSVPFRQDAVQSALHVNGTMCKSAEVYNFAAYHTGDEFLLFHRGGVSPLPSDM